MAGHYTYSNSIKATILTRLTYGFHKVKNYVARFLGSAESNSIRS